MVSKTRVMLIEDNVEYREVIRLALEDREDIELTHQFGTAEVALRVLRTEPPSELPDLVLLDLRLPGIDGLDALGKIVCCAPQVKTIILTQSNHEEDVLRAISLGAAGFLLKSATLQEIIDGVETVVRGGAALDKAVAMHLFDAIQKKRSPVGESGILTARELEIISLLAEGLVKKEIAVQLGIGYSTVDTHVARIYEKLQVTNAPSAVNRAHQLRIFDAREERT